MTATGTSLARLDGSAKVRGTARYAYEHTVDNPAYLIGITSTIARGRVNHLDVTAAAAVDGVLLVLTHENAPRLADTSDGDLTVLQSAEVSYRGQPIGAVIAETPEIARHAASLVTIGYDEQAHDTTFRADHPDAYVPGEVNGGYPPTSLDGNPDAVLAAASSELIVDQWYSTPEEHNNPMEPHLSLIHI